MTQFYCSNYRTYLSHCFSVDKTRYKLEKTHQMRGDCLPSMQTVVKKGGSFGPSIFSPCFLPVSDMTSKKEKAVQREDSWPLFLDSTFLWGQPPQFLFLNHSLGERYQSFCSHSIFIALWLFESVVLRLSRAQFSFLLFLLYTGICKTSKWKVHEDTWLIISVQCTQFSKSNKTLF